MHARAAGSSEPTHVLRDLPAPRAARARARGGGRARRPVTTFACSTCRSSATRTTSVSSRPSSPRRSASSLNYLANVPEVLDLCRQTRARQPECFVFAGGHSGSFIAAELLEHGAGALDCVVRGEGELITPKLLEAIGDKRLSTLPGVVTAEGAGPTPTHARRPRPLSARARSHPPAATSTSSASSIRARRSSSRAAARGTARSAARGRSTGGATARARRRRPPRTWRASASPTCSSWTTWPSSTPSTASPSASELETPGHPQAVLPGDALRRAGAQPGGLRVLEAARPALHVPRHRGHRRGGAASCTASA